MFETFLNALSQFDNVTTILSNSPDSPTIQEQFQLVLPLFSISATEIIQGEYFSLTHDVMTMGGDDWLFIYFNYFSNIAG